MAISEEVLEQQSPLVGIIESLAGFVAGFDTGAFSGSDAARLTELFARGEKLCATGLAMAARRASECSAPERAGVRSREEWLAGISGTDLRSAEATLSTAEQMVTSPELEDACRKGELSTDQAAEIADASKADPSSTGRLIHQAKNRTLKGLREDCRAVRHQAQSRQDDQARLAAMHRNRYFRTWIDRDGTGRGSFSMTPDKLARLRAWMHPYQKAAFDRSRQAGNREQSDRYALDALMDMAEAASHWGAEFPAVPPGSAGVLAAATAAWWSPSNPAPRAPRSKCSHKAPPPSVPLSSARPHSGSPPRRGRSFSPLRSLSRFPTSLLDTSRSMWMIRAPWTWWGLGVGPVRPFTEPMGVEAWSFTLQQSRSRPTGAPDGNSPHPPMFRQLSALRPLRAWGVSLDKPARCSHLRPGSSSPTSAAPVRRPDHPQRASISFPPDWWHSATRLVWWAMAFLQAVRTRPTA